MSIIGEGFDYLFKLVVIGGNSHSIQTQVSEKLIYSPASKKTNSHINPKPLSE